jgi:hypothetical protein
MFSIAGCVRMNRSQLHHSFLLIRDTTSLRWRARVAKAATSAAMGGQQEGDGVFRKDSKDKGDGDDAHDGCFGTGMTWLDGVAAGAVGSSLLSYQLHSVLTKVAAVSTLALGPYAAYQKRKLRLLGGLRQQQNALRYSTNDFQLQNEVLHRKLTRLDSSVSNLEAVEQELALYAKDDTELRRLQHIVARQAEVHAAMRKCLQRQVVSDILEIVVGSDRDRDFSISAQESETMVLRMKALSGVRFNERNYRAHMAAGDRSISCVMKMIRELMMDDDDSNDIFTLSPQDLVSEKRAIM